MIATKCHSMISRRDLLRAGIGGATGLMLGQGLGAFAKADESSELNPNQQKPKAKSVIQIWMWGGPSQLDTFDPKPQAGHDYTGPLNHPIPTNVDGIQIGELLPELAKQADKYSIIRSMTHGINAHETGTYLVQTGRMPGDILYPAVGAVVSYFKGYRGGYQGLIPPYIVLTTPQGRFSKAGFLGQQFKPFATGGDPALDPFAVEGIVAEGISERRQQERRQLLQTLNTLSPAMPKKSPKLAAMQKSEDQAYDLILGDGATVFDLAQESDEMRDRYGHNTFGQSCLAARRLVEEGVPFITINYEGWDTHKNHFTTLRQKMPEMDQGMAALLQDLADRGLLDSTILWWSGEFGRTPNIQWEAPYNGGRGHWGSVFSALLAGGGFQGGQVVGRSDAKGEYVDDRPVYPCDLIGSIYQQLGIAPDAILPHPSGQGVRVTPGPEEEAPSGGLLKEIMG